MQITECSMVESLPVQMGRRPATETVLLAAPDALKRPVKPPHIADKAADRFPPTALSLGVHDGVHECVVHLVMRPGIA